LIYPRNSTDDLLSSISWLELRSSVTGSGKSKLIVWMITYDWKPPITIIQCKKPVYNRVWKFNPGFPISTRTWLTLSLLFIVTTF
jgi:hypothetical protein